MTWRPASELNPHEKALFYSEKWDKFFIGTMGHNQEWVWDGIHPIYLKKQNLVFQELPKKPEAKNET